MGEAFLYNADIHPTNARVTKFRQPNECANFCSIAPKSISFMAKTQVGGRALVLLNLHWKNGKTESRDSGRAGKVARDKRADLKSERLIAKQPVKSRVSIANMDSFAKRQPGTAMQIL